MIGTLNIRAIGNLKGRGTADVSLGLGRGMATKKRMYGQNATFGTFYMNVDV